MQTFHEKEHFKRHQLETEQQQQRRLPPPHQQQTVPFELSPIPRPDTLFTTSTPTLAEGAHNVAHEGRQPGIQVPGDRGHAAAAASVDPTLPSPASAVASLTRDLEQTLSLQSAMRGQFVVKPQVTRARSVRCRWRCAPFVSHFQPFIVWFHWFLRRVIFLREGFSRVFRTGAITLPYSLMKGGPKPTLIKQ